MRQIRLRQRAVIGLSIYIMTSVNLISQVNAIMISRRARLHCLLVSAGECTKHFLNCNIITLYVI